MLLVKDMQPKSIPILVSIVMLLSGCTTPVDVNQSEEIPLQMSFVAKTLDRSEDGGAEYNLKENCRKTRTYSMDCCRMFRLSRLDPINTRIDRKRQPEFYRCQHYKYSSMGRNRIYHPNNGCFWN